MAIITLTQAEQFAAEANINGVAAFLQQDDAKEYDRVTIEVMLETLMQSYIESISGTIDHYAFVNIKRIANLKR